MKGKRVRVSEEVLVEKRWRGGKGSGSGGERERESASNPGFAFRISGIYVGTGRA